MHDEILTYFFLDGVYSTRYQYIYLILTFTYQLQTSINLFLLICIFYRKIIVYLLFYLLKTLATKNCDNRNLAFKQTYTRKPLQSHDHEYI